jgi:L-aminopeptidase/D-esterase-like protein
LLAAGAAVAQPGADAPALPVATDFGARVLEFDLPAMRVGIAEYPDGPTGVTVLHFPQGAAMAVDVRGGSPGFLGDYGYVHAIALAGGSLLGLEAASGVAAGLWARVDVPRWDAIPLVSGGIVFDFGGRDNGIHPDKRLGRTALDNAVAGRFPLGARGAGRHVTVGNGFAFDRGEAAGQGAAFREVGGVKVFVCTVLNAVGAIFDRDGEVVLGHVNPDTGEREGFPDDLERRVQAAEQAAGRNTTLTVVVTNQTVRGHDLAQLGRQVHSSMARAIQPFHTRDDGDVLWAVSTAEVDVPQWSVTALGVLASELAWDAVLEAYP